MDRPGWGKERERRKETHISISLNYCFLHGGMWKCTKAGSSLTNDQGTVISAHDLGVHQDLGQTKPAPMHLTSRLIPAARLC